MAEEQDSYLARLKAQLASLRSENEQLAARMGFDSASSPVVAATAAELSATALRDQPPSVRRARRYRSIAAGFVRSRGSGTCAV